jgi:hypothetical protein
MGKKSRENRERHARFISRAKSISSSSVPAKKELTNAKKMFIGLILIVVVVIGASVAFSQTPQAPPGGSYPINVSPVTYSGVVSEDNNKVSVPLSNVNSSKLVFVDLKLTSPLQTLEYQGRTVPLAIYKGGE